MSERRYSYNIYEKITRSKTRIIKCIVESFTITIDMHFKIFLSTVTVENHPEKGSNFRAKGIYQC